MSTSAPTITCSVCQQSFQGSHVCATRVPGVPASVPTWAQLASLQATNAALGEECNKRRVRIEELKANVRALATAYGDALCLEDEADRKLLVNHITANGFIPSAELDRANTMIREISAENARLNERIKMLTEAMNRAEAHRERACADADELRALLAEARVANATCLKRWYASEPCLRPQAPDDGHACGRQPCHEDSCQCSCGAIR